MISFFSSVFFVPPLLTIEIITNVCFVGVRLGAWPCCALLGARRGNVVSLETLVAIRPVNDARLWRCFIAVCVCVWLCRLASCNHFTDETITGWLSSRTRGRLWALIVLLSDASFRCMVRALLSSSAATCGDQITCAVAAVSYQFEYGRRDAIASSQQNSKEIFVLYNSEQFYGWKVYVLLNEMNDVLFFNKCIHN